MKVRKLYTALLAILISTQIANAQQSMLIVDSNGKVNAISVSAVNYAAFRVSDKWFTITNDGIEGVNNNSISASCTVSLAEDAGIKSFSNRPEIGVCYSQSDSVPTIGNDCKQLGNAMGSYTFSLESLFSGTTYYYRVYVKLESNVVYGEVVKATTLGKKPSNQFVDLGLPSGLLWAVTNIGAATPADDGLYFAWGETSAKSTYGSNNYFDSNCRSYSNAGKFVLDNEYDAASVNCGRPFRMPTDADYSELLNADNCTWTWTKMTNFSGTSVNGYKVTSTKNGNSIFLPASGCRYFGDRDNHGSDGYYWSKTLSPDDSSKACYLYFNGSEHYQTDFDRTNGFTIRPVAEP